MIVGGRPGRALVALLADEGSLSLDQLIELVWPEGPPRTARAALHVHLGSLRKLLAAAPPGLAVERHGERYRLSRSGWDLDVELVAEHSAKAEELLAVNAPEAAADHFRLALELWTGEPFTVGGIEVSATATYRLHLVRLDLEEQLVEAYLAASDPDRAEMLAVRLVEAEPYREHRWAQLMRALALHGRAVDALATYERVRRMLERDLGVSPGAELNRLERSVLTHTVSAANPTPQHPFDLDEIPAPLGDLIGRAPLLAQIETALARGEPVLICGAPGAGKTRLAIEVARRASAATKPVGWVDLRNAAFDHRAFGDGVTRWAREHVSGTIILDNAEETIDEVAELVDLIRRVAPSAHVAVTSRVPLPGISAVITVRPLPVPYVDAPEEIEGSDSVRLLRELLAVTAPDVELDTGAAAELCRRAGGLPLAIRLAADLARSVPISGIPAAAQTRLGPELEGAVDALLEHLGPGTGEAFAAASVVAGRLDADMVAALVGGQAPHDKISRLVDHGLLQFTAGDDAHYSVPEPLREVGVSMLTEKTRSAVLDRLCDECWTRVQGLTLPTATTVTGQRLEDHLERQLPWYRQSLDHLVLIGDDRRALDLVAAIDLQLYSLGWWQENLEFQDTALSIPGPASGARAHVHAIRGRPGQFHQFDEDHNRVALAMATETNDIASRARARYHLGVRSWWAGRHDDALEQLARARADAEESGDLFLIGECVRFTGMALVTAGETERGLATQVELIHMVERMPELALILPHLYMHLGHSRRHVGDTSAALADLGRARDGFEELGNRASLIHVCAGLAEVHTDLGRYDQALEAAAQSLDVSTGGPIGVYDPWTLCTTARVHVAVGDADLARRTAARAIDSLSRTFPGETHRVAVELSSIAHGLGEFGAALRLAGLADATPDRRELPFRSPGERQRLCESRDAAHDELGDEGAVVYAQGATSSLAEAAALLIHPR